MSRLVRHLPGKHDQRKHGHGGGSGGGVPGVPGKEIPQHAHYYHGTGTGGPTLTIGNSEWDSKMFVTPDRSVAEHYADRHVNGVVREVKLDKTVRVFQPEIDPIDYTPDRLVDTIKRSEAAGFGAVHFGGGIGTVVLNRKTATVLSDVTV